MMTFTRVMSGVYTIVTVNTVEDTKCLFESSEFFYVLVYFRITNKESAADSAKRILQGIFYSIVVRESYMMFARKDIIKNDYSLHTINNKYMR